MAAQVTGRVHSVESFGTVDGPGVRFVVFLQGCPMRCLYCHNPDTWDPGGGVPTTVEELLAQYARNEAFYRKGGITVTGGEPLLQIEFVTALFREAKRRGIHTCLDTSGATFRPEDAAALAQFDALCAVTDLVLLDIKQTDPAAHRRLTGRENGNILAFARYLAQKEVPVWVRHVVVPGLTDSEAGWNALGDASCVAAQRPGAGRAALSHDGAFQVRRAGHPLSAGGYARRRSPACRPGAGCDSGRAQGGAGKARRARGGIGITENTAPASSLRSRGCADY